MGTMNRHRQDRVPRTSTLIAFETVARHGSVSRAARELGMLQSSVSRQIATLERQTQARLFDRSPAGVRLTETGRRFYDATVAALGLIENAVEEAARRSSGEGVVIGCSLDTSQLVIMPRYDALQAALGQTVPIRLLTYHRRVEELASVGTADIVLSWQAPEAAAEDRVLMLEEQLRPICAPAYAAAHPEAVAGPIRDWGQLTLLNLKLPNLGWATWQDWFALVGFPESTPRYEDYDSYTQLLQAAAAGRGVAPGWRYWFDSYLAAGTLVPLGDGYLKFPGRLLAWLTPQGRKNPLARKCLGVLEQLV